MLRIKLLSLLAAVMCCLLNIASPISAATPSPQPSSGGCTITSGMYVSFRHNNVLRSFKVFVPPNASRGTAMVVSLHGATGTGAGQEAGTGFSKLGAKEGFIALYPQSSGVGANAVWKVNTNSPDVDFVGSLVKFFHTSGCSSPAKTFVNGFSMGAMLTSRLMCDRGPLFGGAAMVGGVFPPTCKVSPTKPIVVIHGLHDVVVLYDGTMRAPVVAATGPWAVFSITRAAMAAQWSGAKGCARRLAVVSTPTLARTVWKCPSGAPTTMLTYLNGGHTWNSPGYKLLASHYIWLSMRSVIPPLT